MDEARSKVSAAVEFVGTEEGRITITKGGPTRLGNRLTVTFSEVRDLLPKLEDLIVRYDLGSRNAQTRTPPKGEEQDG